MKTFTVEKRTNVPLHNGRMAYLIPGVEYAIDGRRKGFYNSASGVISKDLYELVMGVKPTVVAPVEEETKEEED